MTSWPVRFGGHSEHKTGGVFHNYSAVDSTRFFLHRLSTAPFFLFLVCGRVSPVASAAGEPRHLPPGRRQTERRSQRCRFTYRPFRRLLSLFCRESTALPDMRAATHFSPGLPKRRPRRGTWREITIDGPLRPGSDFPGYPHPTLAGRKKAAKVHRPPVSACDCKSGTVTNRRAIPLAPSPAPLSLKESGARGALRTGAATGPRSTRVLLFNRPSPKLRLRGALHHA